MEQKKPFSLSKMELFFLFQGLNLLLLLLLLLRGLLLPSLLALPLLFALGLLFSNYMDSRVSIRSPRDVFQMPGREYQIDPSLLTGGDVRTDAYLPFEPEPLRMRTGSPLLLLASAATATLSLLPPDGQEVTRTALSTIGFSPEQMGRISPTVLGRVMEGDLQGVWVKDGRSCRAYVVGASWWLCQHCTLIWDGSIRPMTEDDREKISKESMQAYATFADGETAHVYLGGLTFTRLLPPEALEGIEELERGHNMVYLPGTGEGFSIGAFGSSALWQIKTLNRKTARGVVRFARALRLYADLTRLMGFVFLPLMGLFLLFG